MHPRTTELLQYIDDQTAELRAAFESVPRERRAMRPAPDRWSPAEVVHHIVIVERRIAPLLRSLVEQARAIGPERDESSVIAIIKPERFVERTRRIQTGDAAKPRDTNVATVWSEFDDARRDLRSAIVSGDGLALGEVSAPHPAVGALTGYGWIAFVGAHAARHAAQIREDSA
jgi:hypothetical protein